MPRKKSKAALLREAAQKKNLSTEPKKLKADLFDSDSEVDNDDGPASDVKLSVNEGFAARLEHNKKREEMQRLEEKYGKTDVLASDDSDFESEEDGTEDEDGAQLNGVVDEDIDRLLSAIQNKDPEIYQTEKDWFRTDDADGEDDKNKKKKEKGLTLKEYHVQNLLRGDAGADDDEAANGQDQGKSYQTEIDDARKELLSAAHAGDSASDSSDDIFEKKAKRAAASTDRPTRLTKTQVDQADQNPDEFLKTYLSSKSWVPDGQTDTGWAEIESDSEQEEDLAEQYEEAYNLRFEDPERSNEMLRTHSRASAALQSVRREEKNSKRQRARQKEQERREAAELVRKNERLRLRKLKIDAAEQKVALIKQAAGAAGSRDFDVRKWARFLDGDYSDSEWDKMMATQFGVGYYDGNDDGPIASKNDADAGVKGKPVWDDDIDITDLASGVEKPAAAAAAEGEESAEPEEDGDVSMADLDADQPSKKALTKAEKQAAKAAARSERRHIEALVDSEITADQHFINTSSSRALPSLPAGMGGFKYRSTVRESFGLSPIDILAASDEQLNEYSGLKRYASFRDQKKREKDKKTMTHARLMDWRSGVFGFKGAPSEDLFDQILEGKIEVGKATRFIENLKRTKKRKRTDIKAPKAGKKDARVEKDKSADEEQPQQQPVEDGERKKRRKKRKSEPESASRAVKQASVEM